jgi:hypothetical protein
MAKLGHAGRWTERLLARPAVLGSLLVLLGVGYVWAYFDYPGRPSVHSPGWWNAHDQDSYRAAARALAQLDFNPIHYRVSVGYPLLGAPFFRFMPDHPFLIPNLLFILGIGAAFYGLARQFLSRRESVVVVVAVMFLARYELEISLVIPWTTIPTHFIAYTMIYLYLVRRPSKSLVLGLAVLDGIAYLCRPGDGAFLAPLVLASISELWGRRARLIAAGSALLAGTLFVVLDRAFNLAVFQGVLSSYEKSTTEDFFNWDFFQRAYGIFVDGMPAFRQTAPRQLERLPYLLLFLPGLVVACQRLRRKALAPTMCVALSLLLYLGYDLFFPESYVVIPLVHYIAWLFPLFGLLAYLTLRYAWRRMSSPLFVVTLLLPVAVFWFVGLGEADALPVRVDLGGRLKPEKPELSPADAVYDVLLGVPVERRSLHVRTSAPRMRHEEDPGHGQIFHFSRPIPLDDIRVSNPSARGLRLEVRRLVWRLQPIPAPIAKVLYGARATTTEIECPFRTYPADDRSFLTEVGLSNFEERELRTTGRAGVFLHGPYMRLPEGRYRVEWYGQVLARGELHFLVTAESNGRVLAEDCLTLGEEHDDPLISVLEFQLDRPATGLEFRIHVDEQVDLALSRVELHITDGAQPLLRTRQDDDLIAPNLSGTR